jgi:diaminopropionate ammonia-lyase
MHSFNSLPDYRSPLAPQDRVLLGPEGADAVAEILALRPCHAPTPLHALPGLASELVIALLHVKDEGYRLGLGSFKALGGAYALMKLVQQEAERSLGRPVPASEILSPEISGTAAGVTFACATDGNLGRSVAQGAQLMGARAVIFVHSGVSAARIAAIAKFGAEIVVVDGSYDDSVDEAARAGEREGWTILSDTSWPGYEHIPGLVMQGYAMLVREALEEMPEPPTHVFPQACVGGFAAAVAGHLATVLGEQRPHVTVVDPARSACIYESAKASRIVKVPETEPTVMAMLECYVPSMIAFRILERVADGFMTVEDEVAPEVMRRRASPVGGDPAIVSGESGGAGLAGLLTALRHPALAAGMGLGPRASVLVINTEGATDPALYEGIVGRTPQAALEGGAA